MCREVAVDDERARFEQAGAGACHTGRRSCFYRAVPLGKAPDGSLTLEFREAERAFAP